MPRDRVRKWAEHCARALAQFEADGDRIRAVVGDVAQRVGTRVGAAAAQARADALDAVEADAAVCAALAQRQAALVEALGRDERDASDLVAKHCVDDPSVGDLADDPTSSPRAQFDLDLSGDNVLKGSLLDDDDDEADDLLGRPPNRRPPRWTRVESCRRAGSGGNACCPSSRPRSGRIAQCARSCASRADALATRSLEELRGVGELQTTIHDAQANHLETHSDALEAKARAFAQLDTVRALPRVHAGIMSGSGAAPVLRHGRRGRRAKGDGGRGAAPGGGDEAPGQVQPPPRRAAAAAVTESRAGVGRPAGAALRRPSRRTSGSCRASASRI